MAKLYFRYGTVGSAKTLNLLAVAHNYEQQGKRCYIIKPAIDDRFGEQSVASRAGLERPANLVLGAEESIDIGETEEQVSFNQVGDERSKMIIVTKVQLFC